MSSASAPVPLPPEASASVQEAAAKKSRFQPEIQGLRAVAVILVVLYHFWPWHLPGGYVGVDVFFVISGYLITAHLFKEARATGTIKLGRFWARRIRRLLPLSLLVLFLTAIAAVLVLPSTAWATTQRQIIGSALYVQNWLLAADSVDYSRLDEQATAVQHFWSLSVEEQFYVLWPLLLVAALALTGVRASTKRGQTTEGRMRLVFIVLVSLLGLVSLIYSIWLTAVEPAQAYFVTPTRIWEFTLGALLALTLGSRQFHGWVGNLVGWAGAAMILAAALLYSDATPFPGYTALLPTVGAVMVMAAGGRTPGIGIHWWLSLRPATRLGDWSYAIYLWHWPVLVLAPYVHEIAESWPVKVLLIVVVVALSAFTTRFFEAPIRKARIWLPTWRSLAGAALGMLLVIGTAVATVTVMENSRESVELDLESACYGYGALANAQDCEPIEGTGALDPSASEVAAQPQTPVYEGCQAETDARGVHECWLGDSEASQTDEVIAVFGDSHATMWLPALDEIAQAHGRSLLVLTRSSCSPVVTGREPGENQCQDANREIVERLAEDDSVTTVVIAGSQMHGDFSAPAEAGSLPGGARDANSTGQAFLTPIHLLTDAGKDVAVMGETPRMNVERNEDETLPECVALNENDLSACHDDLTDTRVGDRWLTYSQEVFGGRDNFHFIPTEDLVCDDSTCYAVLGGAITYNDNSHVSQNFVRSATEELQRRLEPAL